MPSRGVPTQMDAMMKGASFVMSSGQRMSLAERGLPADAAGRASLRIAGDSMNAMTGCAPLRAKVEQTSERLTLVDVEVADADGCIGGSRYVHDTLTSLLTPGAAFDVRKLNDKEATLTVVSDAIDRPSIRVMAL